MVMSMGIRYYAYAFDADQTERALADPDSILSTDPLADAWGLEPGAVLSVMTGVQAVPHRDMLYLDKAWRHLQALTAPPGDVVARPAHRMFEGDVAWSDIGHAPWVRTLVPDEIPRISRDLAVIREEEIARLPEIVPVHHDRKEEIAWVNHLLGRAREFMASLAADRRGMVYLIG